MEEQDYIELNTLLAKLRVICLRDMTELDKKLWNSEPDNSAYRHMNRRERERNVALVRNIDNIRKQMPLKVGESTITVIMKMGL